MMRLQPAWLCLFIVVSAVTTCRAADISPLMVSRLIDQRLGMDAADHSQFASDAEFLRRVTLDLAGRIPTIIEVHDYLSNTSESRRIETIDRLMHSGVHYRNMATFWRRAWVPQADTPEFDSVTDDFERWLVHRLQKGTRYDELVVEILTLDHANNVPASTTPIGFYYANLSKPENLAASATRAFLGINLDCAQCHDHPFSRWTREQFWQTAAFFVEPQTNEKSQPQPPKVRIPDTKMEYEPALLTKTKIEWPEKLDSVSLRLILVDWMKVNEEQLLAKNAVNRLWAHYFGEAIIEPVDDLSRDEVQTGDRARLLNDLSAAFIASGYDLDLMTEGIVSSHAYRLSASPAGTSKGSESDPDAPGPFRITRATVRGLTGEQLYDSLQTAANRPSERKDVGGGSDRSQRSEFASRFYIERSFSAERSISQALTLMNGSFVNELTTKQGNLMLASLLSSPFMSFDEQIDTVFIAVLGRHARETELKVIKQSFKSHTNTTRESHLGNLFWVLINSSEFNTNH
ncbi:hypothetical protein Pan161_53600 [Gimesia algae]|uniref:DUF1549 domain-containing protein n=2 Tax=Gimesia algae TaxID=2527971 RepID=A0A517VKX8_9PLAN|nr:hypothetical protein Pan161_53600 [Gimesia algae]